MNCYKSLQNKSKDSEIHTNIVLLAFTRTKIKKPIERFVNQI